MAKRFLICGDSWGVGAYRYIGNPPTAIKPIPNTGLDYFLTQQGHIVTNIAKGADSNYLQLKLLVSTLEQSTNYDYIIWIQTEPNRDIIDTVVGNSIESVAQYPGFDFTDFKKCMSYIKTRNYQYAQYIYNKFKVPFILVGGLSAIDSSIENFKFAKVVIPNWLNDITDGQYQLAENMHQDIILKVLDRYTPIDKQFMVEELDRMKRVEEILETHPNFSNGVHHNAEQYKKLAVRIEHELELQSQES